MEVSACTGESNQMWTVNPTTLQIKSHSGPVCIDNGMKNPPSGTTGQCAELGNTDDVVGPEIILANSESNGAPCEENNPPSKQETFVIDEKATTLTVGGRCVAAYRGQPTPVGPLQLWASVQHHQP